jgi:hypothetical protein
MKDISNESHKELKDFIKRVTGLRVNENTVFFKDLKLIGDDADEFMLKFKEAFDLDMTGFKFEDYFVDEINVPFLYFYYKYFDKRKIKRKEFGIEHLQKIIKNKKWIDV